MNQATARAGCNVPMGNSDVTVELLRCLGSCNPAGMNTTKSLYQRHGSNPNSDGCTMVTVINFLQFDNRR